MNTILADGETEIDDFLSPAKADAAQRAWQAWWRAGGRQQAEAPAEQSGRGREMTESRRARAGRAEGSYPD